MPPALALSTPLKRRPGSPSRLLAGVQDPDRTEQDYLGGGPDRRGRRLERIIGYPRGGNPRRRVGMGAPVGTAQALPGGHGPIQLVSDQRPVPDQIPGLGLATFVVKSDGGQAV